MFHLGAVIVETTTVKSGVAKSCSDLKAGYRESRNPAYFHIKHRQPPRFFATLKIS
jgi:hypothetical protein